MPSRDTTLIGLRLSPMMLSYLRALRVHEEEFLQDVIRRLIVEARERQAARGKKR